MADEPVHAAAAAATAGAAPSTGGATESSSAALIGLMAAMSPEPAEDDDDDKHAPPKRWHGTRDSMPTGFERSSWSGPSQSVLCAPVVKRAAAAVATHHAMLHNASEAPVTRAPRVERTCESMPTSFERSTWRRRPSAR